MLAYNGRCQSEDLTTNPSPGLRPPSPRLAGRGFDQTLALLTIEDALVKFRVDIGGQTRNFSVSLHLLPLLGLLVWMFLFSPDYQGVDKRRVHAVASGLVPPAHEGGALKKNRRMSACTMSNIPL